MLSAPRHALPLYLGALAAGTAAGLTPPLAAAIPEVAVWGLLWLMLYATFAQVPPERVRAALGRRRFLVALGAVNFVAVPAVVAAVALWAPLDPAVRLGLCLVLLAPCTDWFIAFARQGGGDGPLAIAATPLLLAGQLVLLALFLGLVAGPALDPPALLASVAAPYATFLLAPLAAAWLTRRLRPGVAARLGRAQTPLLAAVVAAVAATQIEAVAGHLGALGAAGLIYAAYPAVAVAAAAVTARVAALAAGEARTLAFSAATRNSFVVLPLALALPGGGALAAAAVVLQMLVELAAMAVLVRIAPIWPRP